MKLVFSDDQLPTEVTKSIFLAGPSPRYYIGSKIATDTWRHLAVDLLAEAGYDGHVFIPLPKFAFYPGIATDQVIDYLRQIEWEKSAMNRADVLFFYVDRKQDNQGLTTNIEFGKYVDSGRMVYCRPRDAVKVRYMDELVIGADKPFFTSMKEGLIASVERIGEGVHRVDGECAVPAIVFKSEQFQDWYGNVKKAGNELRGFEIKSILTFKQDSFLFGFAAWVNVFITRENRSKTNEWIFSRTATSYVAAYYDHPDGFRRILLTREFRSPANNNQGYVYELAGGSSVGEKVTPIENAAKELEEETGLKVTDHSRFKFLGNRQTFATYLTMRMFAVGIALTEEEFNQVQSDAEKATILGENEEEQITLHIAKESEILSGQYPCDWTTLGIIHSLKF